MNMTYYSRQSQNHNQINTKDSSFNKSHASCTCPNHPDKPVTHCIQECQTKQQRSYCQKCSIMLASQGFNVIKIKRTQSQQSRSPLKRSTPKNTRRLQIEDFITEVNCQIEQLNKVGVQTDKNLRISEQHYNSLISEITSYFQQLKNKIQVQKYLVYNRVLTHRAKVQEQMRVLREQLIAEIEQLSGITIDIENNMEAALSVEQDVYETIMKNYRNQLYSSYQIEAIQIMEPHLPNMSFPQMPTEINDLSQHFQILYEQVYRNVGPSLRQTQRDQSVKSRSCESSRMKTKLQGLRKSGKMIPTILSIHDSESADQKENQAYSFENSAMLKLDSLQMRRALFEDSKKALPQEILLRESLNLTEIRQNEEFIDGKIRPHFSCLQQTIPEEMLTSRASIAGYLNVETEGQSSKQEAQRQDTQTLLIS